METTCGFSIHYLVERFEYYASSLKEIGHNNQGRLTNRFMHIDLEGLQEALTNGIAFPALFLQTPEVDKAGSYDNMSEVYNLTFVVVLNNNRISKAAAFASAKSLTDKIFNRLLLDVAEGIIPGVISGTNEGPFGPVADNTYGWGVSFAISDAYNAEVDPQDWGDLS